MKTQKDDRRSLRTRQTLTQALIDLMQEQRYDAITVQDILDRANVGRSTFYAHFQDKEDLLTSGLGMMVDMFVRHIAGEDGAALISTEAFFEHVKEHAKLYRAMVGGRGMEVMFDQGQKQLACKIEAHLAAGLGEDAPPPAVPLAVTAAFLAGAFLNLVKWWMDNKMIYTPKQMSEMFDRLAVSGAFGALHGSKG